MHLDTLGWDERREAEFELHRAEGLEPGRVSLEHNHVYRVITARGEGLAEAAGRIKYLASGRRELPAVGDWVAVKPNPAGDRDVIQAILPRRTFFSRKAAGRDTQEQVIAANVDTVLIVFGLDTHVKPRALERYVTLARRAGAQPVIILNKSDLAEDAAADVADAVTVAGDAPVHAVSALDAGLLDVLAPYLRPGRTMALLGPSGVGKSSIVNRLVGGEVLTTAAVREWDARGRHTSVHRQMLVSPTGGLIIDTPGMRELQLWDSDDSLDETFADVLEFAPGCRFRDCRHESEPGCAVKAALEASGLPADRYESYLKLRTERESLEKQRDERAQLDAKRKARAGSKALKAMQKDRGR
jgi:ribosome biogenesis GTPase